MNAGWFPDPTGRFSQRHFDGTDWTDQVRAANGQVVSDELQRHSTGFAAPTGTGPAQTAPTSPSAPSPSGGQSWTVSTSPSPLGAAGTTPGLIGLAIAGFGALLVFLSLFALDWAESVTRSDISDNLPSSLPGTADFTDHVAFTYLSWAWWLLLLAVLIGVIGVATKVTKNDSTALRVSVGVIAAVAAVVHAVTVAAWLQDNAEIGAQLGTFGYLVIIAGLAIGPRLRRSA